MQAPDLTRHPQEKPTVVRNLPVTGVSTPPLYELDEALAVQGGREAPLILIEEHLTDIYSESQYRPAIQPGYLVKNWMVDRNWNPPASGERSMVLSIQRFDQGGYEASVRALDIEKIGEARERGGKRGKREAKEHSSQECLEKAGQRAKKRVRHLVKNMGATNIVTLTKREGANTKGWTEAQWQAWEDTGKRDWIAKHGEFWGHDEWASAWDKARRNIERVIGSFPYVAVLEKHRKGNYHLHLAWVGKVNLNLMRHIWRLSCGGKDGGNINSQYIKSPTGGDRTAKIARYISKYVTKHFETFAQYNKKRYWSSRQTLPEIQRYILAATNSYSALAELMEWMDFQFQDRHNFFLFPDGSGFWYNYIPELHPPPSAPF